MKTVSLALADMTNPYVLFRRSCSQRSTKIRHERGEGVISLALAVLIMAALAAGMWVAYKGMFDKASKDTETQIGKIGGGNAAPAGGTAQQP
jgi:hypothetical protein